MNGSPIEKLVKLGFSEYEAKAYVALLTDSPVTGYRLARLSGVPRSAIFRVADNLVARGAVVTLPKENTVTYAAVPAADFLEHLQREHGTVIASLRNELSPHTTAPDLGLVWNIEGRSNILSRARIMIGQATSRIYLALFPAAFECLRPEIEVAISRGVQVVVYTTDHVNLRGGRLVVTPVPRGTMESGQRLDLIQIQDGQEALIGERLGTPQARASWTRSPVLVTIAEHHLVRGGRRRFLTF